MNEHLWSVPAHPIDAQTARELVSAQRAEIRQLLERAHETAVAAVNGYRARPDTVASAIGDVRTIIEIHLSFEEKVLLPFLEKDPPLGPQRALRLLADHVHQRWTLAALHDQAQRAPDDPTLAGKLEALTARMSEEMSHEDTVTAESERDDQVEPTPSRAERPS